MSLPDPLLLSDLLARRVRCDRGLEHGVGQLAWMHPPVHRLLGWSSRPSALSPRRCIWRLDQLRGLADAEALVQGDPAETDPETLERLPTLLGAVLLGGRGEPLGRLADAAFEPRSGRILHYLVARSDPRLPGGSRWRLSPERIVDQRPGEVETALHDLSDLPLARASVRESLLRRSRRWREQWDEETGRLRDQWQQASGRFEQRLEGWLEEPPWDDPVRPRPEPSEPEDIWPDEPWEPSRSAAERPRRGAAARNEDPWPEQDPVPPPTSGRGHGDPDRWSASGDPDAEEDEGVAAGPWQGGSGRRPVSRSPAHGDREDDPWV